MEKPLTVAIDNTKAALKLRRARKEDLQDIYWLLVKYMHPECGLAELAPTRVAHEVMAVLSHGYAFVVERDGKIVGSVGLLMGEPFWYSQEVRLFDRWIYVHPEHRATGAGDMLIGAMQQLSEASGIPLLSAVFSPTDTDRKNAYFRRRGFTPVGEIFVRGSGRDVHSGNRRR